MSQALDSICTAHPGISDDDRFDEAVAYIKKLEAALADVIVIEHKRNFELARKCGAAKQQATAYADSTVQSLRELIK